MHDMAQVEEADAIYATAEFGGYSLWVVPQAGKELADAIDACAHKLQTPSFPPHMTLLGGVVVRHAIHPFAFVSPMCECSADLEPCPHRECPRKTLSRRPKRSQSRCVR